MSDTVQPGDDFAEDFEDTPATVEHYNGDDEAREYLVEWEGDLRARLCKNGELQVRYLPTIELWRKKFSHLVARGAINREMMGQRVQRVPGAIGQGPDDNSGDYRDHHRTSEQIKDDAGDVFDQWLATTLETIRSEWQKSERTARDNIAAALSEIDKSAAALRGMMPKFTKEAERYIENLGTLNRLAREHALGLQGHRVQVRETLEKLDRFILSDAEVKRIRQTVKPSGAPAKVKAPSGPPAGGSHDDATVPGVQGVEH